MKLKEFIFDMIFDCYPKDMENFNNRTEDQSHRLLEKFWNKVEKLNDTNIIKEK